MRTGNGAQKNSPFSWKQKLILTIFFLEVLIYPFIVASQLTGEGLEANARNEAVRQGLIIIFLWTPITVVIGVLVGRRLRENPSVLEFFRNRDVTPDEVPPTIGIFAPLAVIAAAIVIRLLVQFIVIAIPVYLIARFWKKKGLKTLFKWVFRLVMKISLKLKRMSYLGYFFPIIFGTFFANAITKNARADSGGTYILILIQMIVLVSLWKHIRKPLVEHELPIPTTGQPQVPAPGSSIAQPQPLPQPAPAAPSYRDQPLPSHTAPQQYVPPATPPPPNYPLPSNPPLPTTPPLPTAQRVSTSQQLSQTQVPPPQPWPQPSQHPVPQESIQPSPSTQQQPSFQAPTATNFQQPGQQPPLQQNIQAPQAENLGKGEPKGKKKGLFRRK